MFHAIEAAAGDQDYVTTAAWQVPTLCSYAKPITQSQVIGTACAALLCTLLV